MRKIIHGQVNEPFRSRRLASLMEEMERDYKIPSLRNEAWESQNQAVIALYRKISMSRNL